MSGAPDYQLQEGHPIGAYLVYESDGVFVDQQDINNTELDYSSVTNNLRPGDMKFVDQNGDGIINGDDQIRIDDNGTPTFNFGANVRASYGGFDLNVLLQGATGSSLRVQTESGTIGNFLKYSYDNRWSIANPSSEHPRLAERGNTYYTGGNYGNNTYWLFSKNYVRLKTIELGYSLPATITDRLPISMFRAYVSAFNLFTIDSIDFFDPESTNSSGQYYPQSRVINIGFNVTL